MKSLLLVRHAKSSWDAAVANDIDRPLNDRGKHDAPVMAERLLNKNIPIDAFVSSPARRAKKTAEIFARAYGRSKEDIIIVESLYLPSTDIFYEVIKTLDDGFDSVALFSHNPGITSFANSLTDVHTDNIPTSGVFAVKAAIDSWKDFEKAAKEFWFFDYPKRGK